MAAPSKTENFSSYADFRTFAAKSSKLLVVHFYADWAAQCGQMNEVVGELQKEKQLGDVHFIRVEAEKLPDMSEKYKIEAVPTFIFIKNNKEVDRLDGADAAELTKKVRQAALIHGGVSPPKQDLNQRLKQLINAAEVMLFMKGSPSEPKCGFSRQTIAILNDNAIKYGTFDILSDEEVRQGLKKFSDWPTYPQLYVKGELIGGLDIIKELVETNELKSTLASGDSNPLNDRLKTLINQDPVMLFMKGSPTEPKCGFSRTTIEILNKTGIKYGTFDILQNNDVREGLKKYSDWPTYPQLYVKGELIGGFDIIKELNESEELITTLKGE